MPWETDHYTVIIAFAWNYRKQIVWLDFFRSFDRSKESLFKHALEDILERACL